MTRGISRVNLPKSSPRTVKTMVTLSSGQVPVYFGTQVARALDEVTVDMTLYKGVRLQQLLEAVYVQGKKDGARHVRDAFDGVMKSIPHRNPGKPPRR